MWIKTWYFIYQEQKLLKNLLTIYGGAIIIVGDLDEAFDVSNYLAPEHLEVLLVDNPVNTLPKIKMRDHCGILGRNFSGTSIRWLYELRTNHVFTTGETAKILFSSRSIYEFVNIHLIVIIPRKCFRWF